jgi:acryloyl-coenzyme A reductase
MKAVIMNSVGGVENLVEKEVDIPKISDEDVLLKVVGCGICYRDVLARKGFMRVRPPVIPGHEIAGRIVEVGDRAPKNFKKNDLVASLIYIYDPKDPKCVEGRENICRSRVSIGEERDGCYAEYISLPHWILVKIDDPGETPPEAYSFAACVIGTAATRSSEKAEKIKIFNPDHIIVYKDRFSEEVRKLTDGEGVDYVIESVGGPILTESIRSLRWGGKILLIGNVDPSPYQMMLGHLILRENSILGVMNSCKNELREAIDLLRKGFVKPVYKIISLDQDSVREAHQIIERGGSFGRIVIKP